LGLVCPYKDCQAEFVVSHTYDSQNLNSQNLRHFSYAVPMRYKYVLVLVLVSTSLLSLQFAAGQTCGLNYRLLTSSGTIYGLAGLPNQISLPNQTSVTITGKLFQYGPNASNYGGTILVLVLQSSATTQSWYSVTMVVVQESSGMIWTATTTQTNNPLPTQQPVTLSGFLLETYGQCVQPLSQAYSVSPTIAIATGLILIIAVGVLYRKRQK
jgi:hypothetical protein